MELTLIQTNEYLTDVTEELLKLYPDEVLEQFMDFVTNVPYIKNLINPSRLRAKDLPRDSEGKIIVDLSNPHILEDMDYFRPTAIHFEKYGCFTNLRPNKNPKSEFGKWIREEYRRCYEGYVRPSDGEWITGDYYFFLNYNQILLTSSKSKDGKSGKRTIGFPRVWDGHYLMFHYLNRSRNNGNHGFALASRSKGKSLSVASMLGKRFVLGESKLVNKKVTCYITAADKSKLSGGDLTLDKFQFIIDSLAEYTEFPRKRLMSSLHDLKWIMGYKDLDTGAQKGTLNSVVGISSADDSSKLRGTRGVLYILEEAGSFNNLKKLYANLRPSVEEGLTAFGLIVAIGCCCAGTKVYKCNGESVNIEDVVILDKLLGYNGNEATVENISWKQPIGYKECVRITTEKNNYLECSSDHPILALNKDAFGHFLGSCSFYRANELKVGDTLLMLNKFSKNPEDSDNVVNNLIFKLRDNGKGKLLENNIFNNMQMVTIKSIEELGIQRIYNMTADTTHTYISNGFISSNTAGDSQSDFEGMQEIMYNPVGYRVEPIDNVYDKLGFGKKLFSYFFPGYMNYDGCYDNNGNSDVVKALFTILLDRYIVKYNTTDINAITKRIAEIPIVPLEAILRTNYSMFPITLLNERIALIDNDPSFYDKVYVGDLVFDKNGHVLFVPTLQKPIRDFPIDTNKELGALEIYEMPVYINDKIPTGRYIIGLDNYENDEALSMSLGSMFVFDLFTDRIVAEYTGRPPFADDLNELCRKLCLFYNATCMYELNRKITFSYFSRMKSLHLLADTPEYLKEKQLVKYSGFGNSSKGIATTGPVKNFGLQLLRDWLIKPVTEYSVNENNEPIEITKPNLYTIKNRALLKELVCFNPDINVDRIMSMMQVMLYREEKMILYQNDMSRLGSAEIEDDYLGNDDFFSKNYDKRFNRLPKDVYDMN